ncbi:hypothetical protein D3C75_1218620 [compost metagenome]
MEGIRERAIGERLCVMVADVGFRLLSNLGSMAACSVLLCKIHHPQHLLKDSLLLPYRA